MTRVAAIDCGTNSVRLLVADVEAGTGPLVDLDRRMEIVRLGEGVDHTGVFAAEALERTFAACRRFAEIVRALGAERLRFVATSASRDVRNRTEFVAGVRAALGVDPEVVSGDEEARLSFAGATRELAADIDRTAPPFLVVDIGGGSTEFVLGTDAPTALASLDMGCVRITEQYLESDPPAPEELSNAVAAVRDLVVDVPRVIPGAAEAATLVGLAGTVTTVAAIELGIPEYDPEQIHHFVLTHAAAEDVFRTLATETAAQRAHNPGLEAGRVDVIVGGTAVLVGIFRVLGFKEMLVSEADILDGLVRSQVG